MLLIIPMSLNFHSTFYNAPLFILNSSVYFLELILFFSGKQEHKYGLLLKISCHDL